MKRILLILFILNFLVVNFTNVSGQENHDSLDLFVKENTDAVQTQIKHIKDVFYSFSKNETKYEKKLLVYSLRDRSEMFLISPEKLEKIGSETQSDWINIYTYKSDTLCCGLDYFEHYYINSNNEINKITCNQEDYPDGFFSEVSDYYFDNEKLVFVFLKYAAYAPYVEKNESSENRYYFLNNKPIRCLVKQDNGDNENINLSDGLPILLKGNDLIEKTKNFKLIK